MNDYLNKATCSLIIEKLDILEQTSVNKQSVLQHNLWAPSQHMGYTKTIQKMDSYFFEFSRGSGYQ
jgi:hypothetical protein